MNVERFIAHRISSGSQTFSSIIIKIAIAAIALSMMVMIITTNVITGFKNEISEKVFSFWGHIHITDFSEDDSFKLIPIQRDSELIRDIASIDRLRFMPPKDFDNIHPEELSTKGGVTHVNPYVLVPSIVTDNKQFEPLLLKGIDQSYDISRMIGALQIGRFIRFQDTVPSRDLLISQQTAERMSFSIDQKLIVHFMLDGQSIRRLFRISGIYKTGLAEYDRRFGLVDIKMLQELLDWRSDQVTGLEVFIEDIDDLEVINDYIYYELLPPAVSSETVKTKFYQLFEWLELQNINERIISTLMLIVALINMITAILIFVLERNQMIGVLKSLGANNWFIRKIFLYSAARIILYGILIGNFIALLFCFIQSRTHFLKLDEESYYLDHVPIEFNVWSMIMLNISTISIVLIFMLIPTLIISNVKPVKVLHFD